MPKPIGMMYAARFELPILASEAVADLQAFLQTTIGGAFARDPLRAVVLRPEPLSGDSVLYFSDGAIRAAKLAGIDLPRVSGPVLREALPANRSLVVGESE